MTLDLLPPNATALVSGIHLSDAEAAWVRAVGIYEGETVSVLRRAAFGGPLHVRTGCGGEFALDRALAASIEIAVEGGGVR